MSSACAVLVALGIAATARAQHTSDRARELRFDDQTRDWTPVPAPQPGTPEGDLATARGMIRDRKYGKALRALKKWEKTYGPSDVRFPAMLIARAQARIGARDYYAAYETLQRFLGEFEGTELTDEAIRQEFVIAEVFLSGTRRKFLGMRILPADDVALRILDDISGNYAGEQIAEYAIKTKGDYFLRTGDHALAEPEYSRLVQEYPNGRYYPYALLHAAVAAVAVYRGTEFDEAPLIEAQGRYSEYMTRFPDDPRGRGVARELETIRQERAMKAFTVGRYYERTRHVKSALFYYRNVVRDWPGTTAETLAAARLEALRVDAVPPNVPSLASGTRH